MKTFFYSPHSPLYKLPSVVFFMLFTCSLIIGQSIELFEEVPNPSSYLSTAQIDYLENVLSRGEIESYSVVTSTFRDFKNGLNVYVDLDSREDFSQVNAGERDSFYMKDWRGDNSEHDFITVSRSNSYFAAFVQTQGAVWTIFPIGINRGLAIKHNPEYENNGTCGFDSEGEPSSAFDPCMEASICGSTLDILVLFTENARLWLNNITDPAYNQFNPQLARALYLLVLQNITNVALRNSAITDKRVILHYRDFDGFDFIQTGDDGIQAIIADLNTLRDDQDAQNLRNSVRADVVVMMTDRRADDPNYNMIRGGTFSDLSNINAYCIVEIPFSMGVRHTFSHETAHVLGALHNRVANGGDDDTDICSHGWRFTDGLGVRRRTIMAATTAIAFGDAMSRSLNYSNPDVLLNGVATGTIDNDNARTIDNYLCNIVQFYRAPAGLSVRIGGKNLLCGLNGQVTVPATYTANVTRPGQGVPGGPPYSYRWQWSSTGIFSLNSPVIGTGQSMNIQTIYNCPVFYLRVIVTSQANPEIYATDIFHVSTTLCSQCQSIAPLMVETTYITAGASELFVYPNPTNNVICIDSSIRYESNSQKAYIYNANGQLVLTADYDKYNPWIDISNLANGLYWVQVGIGETQIVGGKFLVLK